ncbi:MAG: carbonic anhydrase [Campylobacterota bacterium]|nr:carbonic anhydrase [Campylobacterota bacterium]
MHEYAEGNELFLNTYYKQHEKELLELAEKGQNPKALFIGCSDSRVIPDLMLQTKPGDLFVVRNVGNFVAPYKPDEDYHATASAIEYAVNVLKVSEVIICGHTHCGAIKSLYSPIESEKLIHIKKWLELGERAKSLALLSQGENSDPEALLRMTEKFSIITQIDNLLSYPYVKEAVNKGELHIHGWYYDIEYGNIDYYDPESYSFKPLSALK